MSPTKIRETVGRAWCELERIAHKHAESRLFGQLESATLKAEKEHRAFGKRFTDGRAAYAVSVKTAARLIAAQKVLEQLTEPTDPSWETASDIRYDVVLAYGLAERLREHSQKGLVAALSPLGEIDYARDCAR